jgi:nucleotide-binding universal stress UspA family protein
MASAEEHQVLARGWACHHGPPVFGAAHVLRSTLTPDPDCEYGCARHRPGPQAGSAGRPVAASAGAVLAGGPGTACQPADRRLRFVMKMASSRMGRARVWFAAAAAGCVGPIRKGAAQVSAAAEHGRFTAMTSARRVIVGACGSPGSIRAMRYARDLACRSEATLAIVHAWTPPGGDLADRRYPSPNLRQVWQQAAWQRLRDCVEAAWGGSPPDVDTRLVVGRGVPGLVLVDFANGSADLLIVGAGQRGPLARIRRGRVARYCLAHAECPVLAVPPSALAGETGHGLRVMAFRRGRLKAGRVAGWPAGELNRRSA